MDAPSDVIALWCARPEELIDPAAFQSALAVLSESECERLERFRFDRDRRRFLAGRALVRNVLSQYSDCAPTDWVFDISLHGHPTIGGDTPCGLQFNLSKTSGLVVCGISRGAQIGVDVECTTRQAPLNIAESNFAPSERSALQSLPESQRPRRFFELWTLKESYIKARGLGLTIPLDRFAFHLEPPGPPRIEIDARLNDEAHRWQFVQLQPTVDHLMAVCVESRLPIGERFPLHWYRLAE